MSGGTETPKVRIRTSTTKRMTVLGTANLLVGSLRAFLEDLPEDGVVDVRKQAPDRPGELTTMTIEVTVE